MSGESRATPRFPGLTRWPRLLALPPGDPVGPELPEFVATKVHVRDAGAGKGRGLFLLEPAAPGELLLVCRAFAVLLAH